MNTKTLTQPLSQTMYNLQTKRTLPRDVIKWLQGLDLSYSVKDYRKDLSNGFLIGEIVSRYEPGKIPMHAFQNSHNQTRRDGNWGQLSLFFKKHELRKVKIEQNQYIKIKTGNDPKSEQLYEFVCRLYSVCTKRTLPEASEAPDLPPTQTKNPNLTASYLLKDDGLEKLENSHLSQVSGENQSQVEDRVPTRKVAPSSDSPARVDVKGIGIKQEINRKVTSKKKSWEAKSDSFYEETNQYVERLVFDYLNEILEECLNSEDMQDSEAKTLFMNASVRPTETFKKGLPMEKSLTLNFFSGVKVSVNQIVPAMLKELNEIWKFFIYFIRMMSHFSETSEEFHSLMDILVTYAASAQLNDKKKISKVFLESLIQAFLDEVQAASNWDKKERIMETIYNFTGRDIQDKKAVLFCLKEKLGSNSPLYISWLSVLIRQEKPYDGNKSLVEDFIYYAHQNLSSSNYTLRTSALKILSTVGVNGWVSLIEGYFSDEGVMRKFKTISEFEQVYFASSIYFCLLRHTIEGSEYQTLVKGKNQGNSSTIKVYNPDHEKQTEEIKHKVQAISMTIAQLYHNTAAKAIREVIAKEATCFMTESLPLLLVVVFHLSSTRDLEDFFHQEKIEYEFKTSRVPVDPINQDVTKECANEMLTQLIGLYEDAKHVNLPESATLEMVIEDQLTLINFCLDHLNIKKLNIELWESIGERIGKALTDALVGSESQAEAWSALRKIYLVIFNYDMKMANLNSWLANSLIRLRDGEAESAAVKQIKGFFEQEYLRASNEEVKIAAEEINELLESRGQDPLFHFQ